MSALPGTLAEWVEIKDRPNVYHRVVDGEVVAADGEITLREGLSFADYFARREKPPPPPVLVPYGVFRARWEPDELAGLFAARKTSWQVDDYITLASGQGHVNLSGDTTARAKALFLKLGVLTAERADAIFATA
jgi:hypothetical protein